MDDWGKPGVLPAWVTPEESLERVRDNIKWAPWTFELLHAIYAERQERDYISSSMLTGGCARANVIKRKADYVESIESMYVPFRGTMVHRTMEYHADLTSIAEARFHTTIDGLAISCSPDLLSATTLTDYKLTESPPLYSYPYVHHKEQVELNAFICRHAERWDLPKGRDTMPFDPRETPVKHVVLVYMGPKYVKVMEVERKEEVFTKDGKFAKVQVPFVWPDKLVLKEFRPRLHTMALAIESYPDWPAPWVDVDTKKSYTFEQVWGGEPGWTCPGPPLCNLPNCLARRYPRRLIWDAKGVKP
jgi:hypothetical protein